MASPLGLAFCSSRSSLHGPAQEGWPYLHFPHRPAPKGWPSTPIHLRPAPKGWPSIFLFDGDGSFDSRRRLSSSSGRSPTPWGLRLTPRKYPWPPPPLPPSPRSSGKPRCLSSTGHKHLQNPNIPTHLSTGTPQISTPRSTPAHQHDHSTELLGGTPWGVPGGGLKTPGSIGDAGKALPQIGGYPPRWGRVRPGRSDDMRDCASSPPPEAGHTQATLSRTRLVPPWDTGNVSQSGTRSGESCTG